MTSAISKSSHPDFLGPLSGSRAQAALKNSTYGEMLQQPWNITDPLIVSILGSVYAYMQKEDLEPKHPIRIKREDIATLKQTLITRNPSLQDLTFDGAHFIFAKGIERVRELAQSNQNAQELFEKHEPFPHIRFIKHLLQVNPFCGSARPTFSLKIGGKEEIDIKCETPAMSEFQALSESFSVIGILNQEIYNHSYFYPLLGLMGRFLNYKPRDRTQFPADSSSFVCIFYLLQRDVQKMENVSSEFEKLLDKPTPEEIPLDYVDSWNPSIQAKWSSLCKSWSAFQPQRKTIMGIDLLKATLIFCAESGDMLYSYQSLLFGEEKIKKEGLFTNVGLTLEAFWKEAPQASHDEAIAFLAQKDGLSHGQASYLYRSWWYRPHPTATAYDHALEWIAKDVLLQYPSETLEEQTERLAKTFEESYPNYSDPRVDAEILLFKLRPRLPPKPCLEAIEVRQIQL